MVIVIIVAAIFIIGIILNNSVINAKNAVQNAYSSIDVMLKKRYDLIPNLVEVVRRYAAHESNVLSHVTELRTQTDGANLTNDEKIALNDKLTVGLRQIMVLSENYPQLKANENFIQLQRAWNEVEEQISAARRTYNAAVNSYNNTIQMFPTNIFANMKNLQPATYIEIPTEEKQNLNAKALFNS